MINLHDFNQRNGMTIIKTSQMVAISLAQLKGKLSKEEMPFEPVFHWSDHPYVTNEITDMIQEYIKLLDNCNTPTIFEKQPWNKIFNKFLVVFSGQPSRKNPTLFTTPLKLADKYSFNDGRKMMKCYIKKELNRELQKSDQFEAKYDAKGNETDKVKNFDCMRNRDLKFINIGKDENYLPMLFLDCPKPQACKLYHEITLGIMQACPASWSRAGYVIDCIENPIEFSLENNVLTYKYRIKEAKISDEAFIWYRNRVLEEYKRELLKDTGSIRDIMLKPIEGAVNENNTAEEPPEYSGNGIINHNR